MDRGERMMYATKMWYGREKYDVLQLEDKYFALRGLCVAKDPQTAKEYIIGVGYNLVRHRSHDQQRAVSFRMPILRLIVGEKLSCRELVVEETHVVSLIPHLRPVDRTFQQQLVRESGGTPYHEADKVFHHNIFVTRGSLRYHNELLWFPVNNKDE